MLILVSVNLSFCVFISFVIFKYVYIQFVLMFKFIDFIQQHKLCDPLCENPAKVIFLWFAVFYKILSLIWKRTFCENITFISSILTE